MKKFDFAIAWEWEFDREFVYRLNNAFIQKGLFSLQGTEQLLKIQLYYQRTEG